MQARPIADRPDYVAEAIVRGVDAAMIGALVDHFYAEVRRDPLLAPVFAARIKAWGPHLERMCTFWSSVMLRTGDYHGQPMPLHAPLPIDARHFDRWLELFAVSAQRTCGPAADLFIERARRIAQSLELGVAGGRGILLGGRERLPPATPSADGSPT